MECKRTVFSGHAVRRMYQRQVSINAVRATLQNGEVIASYPDDHPSPSFLLLGWHEGSPVHVVVARDPETSTCQVVTVYRPDPAIWQSDFRRRR